MSGYLEFNKATGEFLEGSYFLQKPFSRESLVTKVDETLRLDRTAGSRKPSAILAPKKGQIVA
jgi:hypothetical protein